jgi:hypothetical protein
MPFVVPLEVGPEGIVGACRFSILSGNPILWLQEIYAEPQGIALEMLILGRVRRVGEQAGGVVDD